MVNKMTMGLGMISIISKIAVAGAVAAAIAVPAAAASASTGFAVQDNGGVLVTTQHVHVGEVLTYKGHAQVITFVHPAGTAYIFRVSPGLGDPSGELTFSALG